MAQLKQNETQRPPIVSSVATNVRAVVCSLLSLVIMTLDHRHHHLDVIRDTLATLVYPVHYVVQVPFRTAGWLAENLVDRNALLAENDRLRQRQLFIDMQLQKLTTLEAENQRLRLLLGSSVTLPINLREQVLIAELLAVESDPYRHHILLNKGSFQGVQPGQPLLDEQGVVGQVIQATPLTATAILITDPNHALPVQDNRNGLRTLATGTGNYQELEVLHIRNNEDIQVGDLLVTSGLGGRFPSGYPVARVTKVEFDPSRPFARVIAQPTTQLERIREVLLIIGTTPHNAVASQVDSVPDRRRR